MYKQLCGTSIWYNKYEYHCIQIQGRQEKIITISSSRQPLDHFPSLFHKPRMELIMDSKKTHSLIITAWQFYSKWLRCLLGNLSLAWRAHRIIKGFEYFDARETQKERGSFAGLNSLHFAEELQRQISAKDIMWNEKEQISSGWTCRLTERQQMDWRGSTQGASRVCCDDIQRDAETR